MAAAQQRIELIARVFAETGVTDLFRKILRLVGAHQNGPRIIRLRNRWVPMDPRSWNSEMDVSVNVGLGTGNRDQMLGHLNAILGIQAQAIQQQGGVDGPRSEEHTSELQSLMRNPYAVFCLKKKKKKQIRTDNQ